MSAMKRALIYCAQQCAQQCAQHPKKGVKKFNYFYAPMRLTFLGVLNSISNALIYIHKILHLNIRPTGWAHKREYPEFQESRARWAHRRIIGPMACRL